MEIPYSSTGINFGSGLGLVSKNPFVLDFKPSLITAQAKAVEVGNKNWQKVLDAILKYGGGAVAILASAGVLKNKNIESISSGDFNQNALNSLLSANGGTLDKNPNNIIVPTNPTRSAIDISNPVVLVGGAALLYLVFKK